MSDDEKPQAGDVPAADRPVPEPAAAPPKPAAGESQAAAPGSGKGDAAAPPKPAAGESQAAAPGSGKEDAAAPPKPAAGESQDAAPGSGKEDAAAPPKPAAGESQAAAPGSGKQDAAAPQAPPAGSSAAAKPAAAKAAPAAPAARAKPAPPQAPPLPPELQALRGRIGTLVEGAEADESNDLMLGYIVPREGLPAACRRLRDDFGCDYLSCLSGVDYPEYVEVVYHLFSTADATVKVVLKARAPKTPEEDCVVPSVTSVWPGADWHEREAFDLLGVAFEGHPDLRRILLPEDWSGGYPLRKDFADQRGERERQIRVR